MIRVFGTISRKFRNSRFTLRVLKTVESDLVKTIKVYLVRLKSMTRKK